MKARFIFSAIGILCLSVITGCESYVDIDIPEQEPKVVLGAFISPQDDSIKVIVRSSSPVFGSVEQDIFTCLPNAVVTLSSSGGEVLLPFDEGAQVYCIQATDFPIVAGETYTLQVDVPGYKTVTASTQVPAFSPVISSLTLSSQQPPSDFSSYYSFDVEWQDPGNEANFYRVSATSEYAYYSRGDVYTSDEDENGQLLREDIVVEQGFSPSDSINYRIYLLNANESYYRYMRSIQNITYGDPFSEPSIIYTNVTNGLGCFGAFNGTSKIITIHF